MTELSGPELNKAIAKELLNQVGGAVLYARLTQHNGLELDGESKPLPNWAGDTDAAMVLFRSIAACRMNRLLIDMAGRDVEIAMAATCDSEVFFPVSVTCKGATLAEAISRLVLHVLRENDQFELGPSDVPTT